MKRLLPLLLVICVAALVGGCASTGGTPPKVPIQAMLNDVLPDDFRGNIEAKHWNSIFDISFAAVGLRKVDGVWHYSSLTYHRNGRWSTGDIRITNPDEIPSPRINDPLPPAR